MSIGTIILLGMGSQDLLVTLGYGSGITQPPSPPPVQSVSREHWGHWPLVRRRISSTSDAYSEEAVEEVVEEVEEEVREVVISSRPTDWDRILDNALQKIQAKIEAEVSVNVKARKEERRRAAFAARKELERLQEEELIQVLFMID